MDVVAQKVAHHVINRRLPPESLRMRVRYNQQVLSPDQTIAQAGILPMSFVEVFYDASVRSRATHLAGSWYSTRVSFRLVTARIAG